MNKLFNQFKEAGIRMNVWHDKLIVFSNELTYEFNTSTKTGDRYPCTVYLSGEQFVGGCDDPQSVRVLVDTDKLIQSGKLLKGEVEEINKSSSELEPF